MRHADVGDDRLLFVAIAEDALVEVPDLQVAHEVSVHPRVLEDAAQPAAPRRRLRYHSANGASDSPSNGALMPRAKRPERRDVVAEHRDDLDDVLADVDPLVERFGPRAHAPQDRQQRGVVVGLQRRESTGQEARVDGQVGAERQAPVDPDPGVRIVGRGEAQHEIAAAREAGEDGQPRLEGPHQVAQELADDDDVVVDRERGAPLGGRLEASEGRGDAAVG